MRRAQAEEKPVETPATVARAHAQDEGRSKRASTASDADRRTYTEPLRVREEKRQRWEGSCDAAIYLSEARVAITFGSGKSTRRELVEIGLPLDIAMAGLMTSSAVGLGASGASPRARSPT